MPTERLLLVDEVADRLQASVATVRTLIHRGDLEAINVGTGKCNRYRITEAALEKYIASNRVPKPAPKINVARVRQLAKMPDLLYGNERRRPRSQART